MNHYSSYLTNILRLFFIILLLISKPALALTSSQEQNAINQNLLKQQYLERERRDIINRKNIEENQRIRDSLDLQDEKSDEGEYDKDSLGCVKLQDISISGNEVFTTKFLKNKFLKHYECVKKSDLKNIKKELTNYYISKGYSNARIYFDLRSLEKKLLAIFIAEGKIEDVSLSNNSKVDQKFPFRKKSKLFAAFGAKKDEVFNLRDFEQGIDQINRLQSSSAKMDIKPSQTKAGYSNIVINNEVGHQTNLGFSYDNSGQTSSGKYKKKITISQDNLLGLYDNLYLNYSKDDASKESERFSKSLYSSVTIPYGYWTFNSSYSRSDYLTTVKELSTSYGVEGTTKVKSFGANRVLARGKRFKTKLGSNLSLKDTDSYNAGSRNVTGSRKLSIAELFSDNIFYTNSGTIFIKPSYVKGLDIFDAKSDLKDIRTTESHNQYNLAKLYGYYNTNFNIPKTDIPLNYMLTFDSQISEDTLQGTEKFSLGGQYSVRGFENNAISGDNGYNIKSDLKINTIYLFPNGVINSKLFNFGATKNLSISNALSKTYLSVFYDYGYARDKLILGKTNEGIMSGVGTKLSYSGQYLDWNLAFSKGLHSPKFIQNIYDQREDEETIYFDVSLNIGLF